LGITRFGRWHIDCAMYDKEPPRVTALRALTLPRGPLQTLRWDDGSGTEMQVSPGLTAFYSCEQLYEMLTPEERAFADNSRVAYAPHPYMWISRCKQDSLGMTIPQGQGKELPPHELPPVEESKLKEYPMVWHNEVTGKAAFMVHSIIAQRLLLRNSPEGKERVVDDVDEVRAWLYNIHRRMVEPENILVAPYEEGDVAVWNNRCMQHTFIEYPASYGPRTMHQVNLPASIPPS
jgi:xanthine dioxygenase